MLKSVARAIAGQPSVGKILFRLQSSRHLVIMMHRFAGASATYQGHDPKALGAVLAYLRKCNVQFESLDAFVTRALYGEDSAGSRRPSVIFTVDDGYADVSELAQPVFAEFDCPYTLFVAPDVVDGKRCFWWDQLAWMMQHGRTSHWIVPLDGAETKFTWTDPSTAFAVRKIIEARLKSLAEPNLYAVLSELSRQADVPLFASPPNEYRILDWDGLRALERGGACIGAHSMTHVTLSACDDQRARVELEQSLLRVRAEMHQASRVFCYPFGKEADFGEREAGLLASLDCLGAISSESGTPNLPTGARAIERWRWRIPRMAFDPRPGTVLRAFFD